MLSKAWRKGRRTKTSSLPSILYFERVAVPSKYPGSRASRLKQILQSSESKDSEMKIKVKLPMAQKAVQAYSMRSFSSLGNWWLSLESQAVSWNLISAQISGPTRGKLYNPTIKIFAISGKLNKTAASTLR